MSPWLSILIPVYNVADYLEECLNSVLNQCDNSIEIILLDDKSTDNSLALAQAIAAKSQIQITIIEREQNGGLSAARNRLIAAANGEYLWFLDSDDIMAANAIFKLREIVTAHQPDLVMCDYSAFKDDASVHINSIPKEHVSCFKGPANSLLTDPAQLFIGLFEKGKMHCWSKVFKREIWNDQLRFPVGRYFEDMVVTPRLALQVKTYYYTPQLWIYYRQREGSILALPSLKKIDDMNAGVSGIWAEWISKHPDLGCSAQSAFIKFCVKIFFFSLKDLKKIQQLNSKNIERYKNNLLSNTQCSRLRILGALILKGKVSRALKLLRYFY
jgi:glycosyltransferase involved in cell wall biosynthesis